MQKSCFHRAVPKRAEESRRKPKKTEVSRANKREECLYFVDPQRLATHVTRLARHYMISFKNQAKKQLSLVKYIYYWKFVHLETDEKSNSRVN
jgi:hypothetical protein